MPSASRGNGLATLNDLQLGIERRKSALDRHNTLIEELAQKQSLYNDQRDNTANLDKLVKDKALYPKEPQYIGVHGDTNSQKKIYIYNSPGS